MKEKIIISVNLPDNSKDDLEVPIFITANELVLTLGYIYALDMKHLKKQDYYLRADNPKALLRGNRTLEEYGLRDGTNVWLWNE